MSEITCRVVKDGKEIFSSDKRGINPVVTLVESGIDARGGRAYDKIVGKAAALLYVLSGVDEVEAEVMSVKAAEIFDARGIRHFCRIETERIINRRGDGLCPMEEAVKDIDDPSEGLKAIKRKAEELNSLKQTIDIKKNKKENVI